MFEFVLCNFQVVDQSLLSNIDIVLLRDSEFFSFLVSRKERPRIWVRLSTWQLLVGCVGISFQG